jgi:membrane-bound lytic murein transglycosylase
MQRHLNNMNWLLPALVGSIWLLAAPAAAQTYKWTDADGKVHYSDQPPPANIKETVTVKPRKQAAPATKDAPAAKAKDYVEQEAAFKKRQVETAEREAAEKKATEDSAEKKRNCDQVRTQLKSMQAGGRVVQANAQGEREYMSDAQIAQEIERLKKAEANLCK